MSKILKSLSRAFSFSSYSTGATPGDVGDEEDLRSGQRNNKTTLSRKQSNSEKKLNNFYDDVQVFDAEDCVTCMQILDNYRIAAGLLSGRVTIWDTADGRQLHSLHNHKRPITLLEVVRSTNQVLLVSAGKDDLITLWDSSTGEMLKYFRLNSDPRVRFIHDISRQEDKAEQVTLLCGRKQLAICQIYHQHPDTPVSTEVVKEHSDEMVEILVFPDHVVWVSGRTVVTCEKNWDSKGKLTLKRTNRVLPHSDTSLYSCATLVSDEMFAVGTTNGNVYICKLNHDSDQPFRPEPLKVTRLQSINKVFLAVIYTDRLHIVHIMSGKSEYYQEFATRLVAVVARHNVLVTACLSSSALSTWDLPVVMRDGRPKEYPQPLPSLGELLLSESEIKDVLVMESGLITHGGDSLILVWRNKYEEMLRLLSGVQEEAVG